jgi:hypothetical protein
MHSKLPDIAERVATFTAACAEKLRRQNSHCNLIMVFIHTNGFRKDQPQYSRNIVIQTDFPTNSTIELNHYAQIGLKAIFFPVGGEEGIDLSGLRQGGGLGGESAEEEEGERFHKRGFNRRCNEGLRAILCLNSAKDEEGGGGLGEVGGLFFANVLGF